MTAKTNKLDRTDKMLSRAEVFADFWLGIAAAGARGMAEMLVKPPPENPLDRTFEGRLDHTVDRVAEGLRIALGHAGTAAESAQKELSTIRARENNGG
jgi:hypothetical protein